MEQWTEQTSLRLLELIASTAIALSADPAIELSRSSGAAVDRAELPLVESNSSVIEVLSSLAAADRGFNQWLTARTSAPAAGQSPVLDWQRVAEDWLSWLAAEPLAEAAPSNLRDGSRDASPTGECVQRREQTERYRRLLIANAQVALRVREVQAERKSAREDIARGLAYDMAYGLSHELNNPLANIATRARVLAEEEASERKKQLLSAIVDQAMRGCEMIADLMLIARPPAIQLQTVELSEVAREIFAKARPWTDARGLSLLLQVPEQPVTAVSDRSALVEAVWALLRNAIEVARHRITLTVSAAPENAEASRASRAMLSVHDDGPGLSPHAQAHAFNPFFSGREAGRGLGVGLAKADRIARLSGGSVSIANAAGGGCIAQIELVASFN